MNREIKFRAWDKKTKHMIATGFHVIGEVTMFNMIEQYLYENLEAPETMLERLIDVELMQFTGLRDSKGNEAYEGDLIKLTTGHPDIIKETFEIIFHEGAFQMKQLNYSLDRQPPCSFAYYGQQLQDNDFDSDPQKHFEVIGNIYESPEIVKEVAMR